MRWMVKDKQSKSDNVYLSAAANVTGEASGSKEVKILHLLCLVTCKVTTWLCKIEMTE